MKTFMCIGYDNKGKDIGVFRTECKNYKEALKIFNNPLQPFKKRSRVYLEKTFYKLNN